MSRKEFVNSIRIVQKGTAEERSGAEILYLQMHLAGKIVIPEQKRYFLKSVLQIMTFLIDQNDADRFRRALGSGDLVNRKNYHRLLKYAQDPGRFEIVDLMNGAAG